VALVGEGQDYYSVTNEQVARGASADGADNLTHTGVRAISNITDQFGVTYTQDTDYKLTGNTVDWSVASTGTLSADADYRGSTMAAKTFATRDGGESLSSDVFLVQCKTVGAAGSGKYDVYSLIEGVTATAVSSGITRTDIVPGVKLYVTDTTGSTIGDGCSFTSTSGYNANEPDAGTTYSVDYTYAKTEADYVAKTFYKLADVITEYGSDSSDNTLTIGARIVFEQAASSVVCVPVYGLTGSESESQIVAAYRNAVDKLEGQEVQIVVPLYPSQTLASYVKTHVLKMSGMTERKERRAIFGGAVGTTIAQFLANVSSLAHQRVAYVAPDGAVKTIGSTTYTLDGTYLAAAVGGAYANPGSDLATSRTRFELAGFDSLNTDYLKSEANQLAGGGVLVIEDKNGTIRIRHALSTDMSTVNTKEIVVVDIGDYVAKATRTALEAIYVPKKITSETPGQVQSTTKIILDNLVRAKIIKSRSDVSAVQDTGDPTIINVTFSIYPVYPANIIDISFAIGAE
jgi:hypothetical protein